MEVIGFPKLIEFSISDDDHMEFSHNPKLQELHFPAMALFIIFNGSLTVANNSALKAIRMPAIKRVETKDLTIVQNPSLEVIEIDGPQWIDPYLPYFLNIQGTRKW